MPLNGSDDDGDDVETGGRNDNSAVETFDDDDNVASGGCGGSSDAAGNEAAAEVAAVAPNKSARIRRSDDDGSERLHSPSFSSVSGKYARCAAVVAHATLRGSPHRSVGPSLNGAFCLVPPAHSWPVALVLARPSCAQFFSLLLPSLVEKGFIVFVIVDSTTNGYIRDGIQTFLRWIEDNPVAGFFVFMGVYFIATILFVPGLIFTLGSGFVFSNAFGMGLGLVVATISVFVGASLGSIVAFILGRFILRDWVKGLADKYPVFRAIDRALEEKGLRIMVLLRLLPVIPFDALNYISGITAVSLKHYSLALFAILPGTIIYVFLGASANSLANLESSTESAALTISIVVIGVVLGIIAIVATSRYAKKELNRILAEEQGENANNEQKDGDGGDDEESTPNSQSDGEGGEDRFDEEENRRPEEGLQQPAVVFN